MTVWNVACGVSVRKLLVAVTGWPWLSVPVAVTVYDLPVLSVHLLCQLVWPARSAPATASPLVLTVTSVIVPPLRALTVMPFDGSASAVPEAGVILRYFAAVVPATAVGLSCVATGPLP